jgi:hypothetical protein
MALQWRCRPFALPASDAKINRLQEVVETHMKSTIGTLVVFFVLGTSSARAQCILNVASALTSADPVQLGRLSRNGIPQDWSDSEEFPGIINAAIPYRYHTYRVTVRNTPYVQINFDSISANTFVSAYDSSYDPATGLATNWLGDAGFSANFPPPSPIYFQVRVPQNHDLLVVVNNTGAGNVGVGDPFRLIVEGFADSEFTERVRGLGLCKQVRTSRAAPSNWMITAATVGFEPRELLAVGFAAGTTSSTYRFRRHDIALDGQRFLMIKPGASAATGVASAIAALGELKRLVLEAR